MTNNDSSRQAHQLELIRVQASLYKLKEREKELQIILLTLEKTGDAEQGIMQEPSED